MLILKRRPPIGRTMAGCGRAIDGVSLSNSFILDCRQERTPSRGEYVSVAQMTWLKSALSSSPCHFKVILNSVPIAQLPDVWLMEDDRWQGYPRQRDELLNFIVDTPIDNVWFLAGDFHIGAVWRVESSGPRQQIWEILCGPGGQ